VPVGAAAAIRGWPVFVRFASHRNKWYGPILLWFLLVGLHVGAGRLHHLPTIKIWAPE
jgi:hypothetical protein